MLETLQSILQNANAAVNLDEALSVMVRQVKLAMAVDVCSVYLRDTASRDHVLMASDGLNPQSVGKARMAANEGIIGLVAARAEPINLENAAEHPSYFPDIGEERYQGFLGIPLVHFRKVLGVLVVRQRERRLFDRKEEAFLVAVGAQLSGALSHASEAGPLSATRGSRTDLGNAVQGSSAAPGIAIGTIVLPSPFADLDAVADRRPQDIAIEEAAFRKAVNAVREELTKSVEITSDQLPPEARAVLDVYSLMLSDRHLVGNTVARIRAGNWAPGALRETIAELTQSLEAAQDAYLRARAEDIRALGRRILLRLQVEASSDRLYPERTVLLGEEVSIMRIAQVPAGRLVGVVCLRSSGLSHMAIAAKGLGIPAVVGIGPQAMEDLGGHKIIVDGNRGRVFIEPRPTVVREYERLLHEELQVATRLQHLHDLPAETPDGVKIKLQVNIGLLSEIDVAKKSNADGVGLFRTEFNFLIRDSLPTEDEQYHIYRTILESFAPKPVVLRTLDVGGDKPLPSYRMDELNPSLGCRGIRFTLEHPEIFMTQLRAMLRANAGLGNLQILLPMVSQVHEVKEARGLLERAQRRLEEEGGQFAAPPVGVMIEVPSAVFNVVEFAKYVDFFSVGTNDLTQYLLAVDRNNSKVLSLYDEADPSVLRALYCVVRAARWRRIPVSVCGEMAGDPVGATLLLGMGIDTLSMNAANVSQIKWVIRTITQEHARTLFRRALQLEDGKAIRQMVCRDLESANLGELTARA